MSVSSNSSANHPSLQCLSFRTPVLILTAYTLTKALVFLPFSVFIIYVVHQRWRQQHSHSASHSDMFTYHVTAMEVISLLASTFLFSGIYTDVPWMVQGGFYVLHASLPGLVSFHVLTCVDRYLAVVHPITYRGLRQSGGVRIRNVSIGCVWLLCLVWIGILVLYTPNLPVIIFLCFMITSLFAISFCSLCVLCVLIRPGPGDVGGEEEQMDQLKQRAFHTVRTILALLWLWFIGFIVCITVGMSMLLSSAEKCVVIVSGNWLSLPSSLVLPLLFLHRAGKLSCCQSSNE